MPAHVLRVAEVVESWGVRWRLVSGGWHEWAVDGQELRWGSVNFTATAATERTCLLGLNGSSGHTLGIWPTGCCARWWFPRTRDELSKHSEFDEMKQKEIIQSAI